MSEQLNDVNCDACGRCMTYGGMSVAGISIELRADDSMSLVSLETLKHALSEIYPEIELNRAYNVCYVCWLRSLGVKLEGAAQVAKV